MRYRAHSPQTRSLTLEETHATAQCLKEHWPSRTVARMHVEWNSQLVIEWSPGSGPVIEQRLPLAHVAEHGVPLLAAPAAPEHSTNYRQDRAGELWHIIPQNEHGLRGRALCGAPRRGTRLSEAHAETPPTREQMCWQCLDRLDSVDGKERSDVLVSAAV
jgi:diadenosine tetraphosphatase ApaH/serine/threonine PP2A family protein phosphatase